MTHILKIQIPPNLRGGRALLAGSTKHVVMCRALCHGRVSRTPPVFLEDLFVYLFIYFKKRGTPDILLDFTWTNSIYSKIFSGHMLLEHHICIRFYSIDFLKRKWTQNLGLVPLSLLAQLSRVLKGCQMADILHDRA